MADVAEGVTGGDSASDLEPASRPMTAPSLSRCRWNAGLGALGRQGRQGQYRRDGAQAGVLPWIAAALTESYVKPL